MIRNFAAFLIGLVVVLWAQLAHAGDGATLVFREGHVAHVDDGYQTIVDAYKRLGKSDSRHQILEMTLNGGSFLIDLAEVVIVCRDKCVGLEISDPRRTSKITKSSE